MIRERRTKIVCTIGPSCDSEDRIREMIRAGMDVARLNFSHGDHAAHGRIIDIVRRVAAEEGREIGILQDLGGPKIRLGTLINRERTLATGETVRLFAGDETSDEHLPVNYPHLTEDVKEGDRILLADGLVELSVISKSSRELVCKVLLGGKIHSHKGVNLPSSTLRIPAFTEKDKRDLAFGLEKGVDFVALSFVRHERDVAPVFDMVGHGSRRPLVIAKIEKPQALQRFDAILQAVDSVMVARGDLGVETPLHQVPIIQKRIIRSTRQAAKPVITATQMLRSMISSPRPTRAETTDVANAILDGTDAVMLSDETAMGAYPVESVRVLDRIAVATESYLFENDRHMEALPDHLPGAAAAISHAVVGLADALEAAAVVASTSSGSTARLVSRLRPRSPILGFTHSLETFRQLSLSWGVTPVLVPTYEDTDAMFDMARRWVLEQAVARKGNRIVLTAGVPIGVPGTTNMVKVIEL
ncbi:pyruvate kinase [Desulfacinum hydrothermale DSM 13146]|uniref:Pyruvate kinase n=1 Tax=Desulfacinum hydrothermale DSM 13146 TaxID=1121390 RepID=A0A1W1XUZ1_9BACT|nr:pyruvate kinase [Desulfacinum hydrothermale]SMC27800.1 pyruvate kinase [Desulfacinum hydrothermale DSM 13146]